MKRLSLYLFLLLFTLQTPSQADDISDFQIEGMSIGDSLLDYISEKEVIKFSSKKKGAFFYNKEFVEIYVNLPVIEDYDKLHVVYKTKDDSYAIHSISGIVYYQNDMKKCIETKKNIINQLSEIFKDTKIDDKGKIPHDIDKSGESISYVTYFWIKSGGHIEISCDDVSEKLTNEKRWKDQLAVSVTNKEFSDFLSNVYYD